MQPTLVLGIGNLLMGDEGAGVHALRAFTGVQLSGELLYRATQQVTLMVAYAQLVMGPALREAGGEHVRFFAGSLAYAY